MKKHILIGGGTGVVGNALINSIDKDKYKVTVLVRSKDGVDLKNVDFALWDASKLYMENVGKPDIIINLAGAGIADGRWTDDRKKVLIESRTKTTQTIQKYLVDNNYSPALYISAGAVGIYGDSNDQLLTEESKPGKGFLATCSIEWEKAAMEVGKLCKRYVISRLGVVMTNKGGALPKIMMTKGFGFLSYFGDGSQYFPWIDLEDVVNFYLYTIEKEDMNGVFNLVSPDLSTNKQVVEAIKKGLNSKALIVPAPKFGLRLLMGEMADVVLNSNKVSSQKLQKKGFDFKYDTIEKSITNWY